MITQSSRDVDMPVQVCIHVCNCFATAAQFEACRDKIAEMKALFKSICQLLKFEVLLFFFYYSPKILASPSTSLCSGGMCLCIFCLHSTSNPVVPGGGNLAIVTPFV